MTTWQDIGTEGPDDVVGRKTFDTGEVDPETGFPKLRHEPLTRAEADRFWKAAEAAKASLLDRLPERESRTDEARGFKHRLLVERQVSRVTFLALARCGVVERGVEDGAEGGIIRARLGDR